MTRTTFPVVTQADSHDKVSKQIYYSKAVIIAMLFTHNSVVLKHVYQTGYVTLQNKQFILQDKGSLS